MASNAEIESNIEYWSKRVDRLRGDLDVARLQLSAWMAMSPETNTIQQILTNTEHPPTTS